MAGKRKEGLALSEHGIHRPNVHLDRALLACLNVQEQESRRNRRTGRGCCSKSSP